MSWASVEAALFLISLLRSSSNGHPIDTTDVTEFSTNFLGVAVVATAFLISTILLLLLCSCCGDRRDGFKEFENPSAALGNVGFTNSVASEVAIFPPPGLVAGDHRDLPFLTSKSNDPPSRPAGFPVAVPDVSDWFGDPSANFPRHQLFYQKEIGKGWFGKVVEGEARGIKVVVRILREDATAEEKAFFLQEARIFRDLRHKNISRLFGRCLEIDPYLLLFELHSNKDLKNFLLTNSSSRRAINEQGICLKLMTDVCEGLKFMLDNGFIHTDLAARNCLVTSDLTVKIGDYGTSIDLYKNEYYIAGDVAVPIRWCAPETLHCTSSTIETKQVTASANVWSVGVVLWEISEFGRLPYDNLSDDQVIVKVFGEESCRLPQPQCLFSEYLYKVMLLCWKSKARASIDQILSMLLHLKTNPYQEAEFETRWRKLKPNTVPVVDNHTPVHSPRHTELAQRPRLSVKNEFDSGVDLEIKASGDELSKTSSVPTISPQLSVNSEEEIQSTAKSPSLTNLQGSMEDVSQLDSWLHGVEQKSEENRESLEQFSLGLEYLDKSAAESSSEASKNRRIDFRLGPQAKSESSSDTEEETWRCRIERGEFSEKVKEKSKSVTDLMVLTHIDSEDSENDSLPSLTKQYSLKRNSLKGSASTYYTSIGFGSEGNIRNAVLGEELQQKLKSLTMKKNDASITTPKPSCDASNSETSNDLFSNDSVEHPFLANAASDPKSENCGTSKEEHENVNMYSVNCASGMKSPNPEAAFESHILQCSSQETNKGVPKIVITESEIIKQDIDDCDNDSQYFVQVKPRKFVLVCRDDDDDEEVESSVILGSCEEHTLDYFKGLRTTCSPADHMTLDIAEDDIDEDKTEENVTVESARGELDGLATNSNHFPLVISSSLPNITADIEYGFFAEPSEILETPISSIQEKSASMHSNQGPEFISSDFTVTSDKLSNGIETLSSTSVSDDLYSNNFDYYSADKGIISDRDKQISDLKNQLEDIMHCGGDEYQTKVTEDEYGGKLLTPDDERSSDSGFRDKGSLSESVEDTCDEKYNLEDIDAELDDFGLKQGERELKDRGPMFDRSETALPIEGWFLQQDNRSGWTSLSTEDDDQQTLTLDAEFVMAIRNELKEKLPCAQKQTDQTMEDECSSPVHQCDPAAQFPYPAQLSPILEEQESNQSSLVIDDSSPGHFPVLDFDVDLAQYDPGNNSIRLLNSELGDSIPAEDDMIIIDTETNEVTLVGSSETLHHQAINSKKEEDLNNDDDQPTSTPDLTVSLSSTSSPEKCNHSGIYMSPSSIRSDLFDSGPPSLPFDLGQSLEEVEEISIGKPASESYERVTDLFDSLVNGKSGLEASNDCKTAELHEDFKKTDFSEGRGSVSQLGAPTESSNTKQLGIGSEEVNSDKKNTPIIVVDDCLTKEKIAESAIDRLLEKTPWERLYEEAKSAEGSSNMYKQHPVQEYGKTYSHSEDVWPSLDELLPPHATKHHGSSTLALTSPDLSSDDSKSHSLLSSHSSTPTYEETKSQPPSSLPLSPHNAASSVSSVPMPSPEDLDKSWRPTIGQLLELTDQAEGEEMTTSFIEPDENGPSTPGWESDTSDEHSSSSGDFIWKEGEKEDLRSPASNSACLPFGTVREPSRMEIIDEEDDSPSNEDDDCSSEGSGTDFVPSSWSALAKPQKSALKTIDSPSAGKKKVVFKKEKYQCVYEYPKEPSDEEDNNTDGWSSLNAVTLDYSTYADWDLSDVETPISAPSEVDSDCDDSKKSSDIHDFYRLNYSLGSQLVSDDGDFYISSSSRALGSWENSDSASEFFPGRDSTGSVDENLFNPPAYELAPLTLGGLRHTKDSLRLDLPPLNQQAANPDKAEAVILDNEIDASHVTSPIFLPSCISSSSEA